ncbi:MAG: nucleoside phosphorylase [Eubacteriales bacterium]|nr:nucleoside phosphorylase [Eubacteriales bacterium]
MKRYYDSKPRYAEDGTLLQTGLKDGDVASGVLLPGDPHRSKLISTFFDDAEFRAHRGTYATFTGKTPKGLPVSVMSSGMGCACVATALEELKNAGAEIVIRVGTCGGVQPGFKAGTIVIASGCVRGEGASYEYVPQEYPAVADPYVVNALVQAAHEMGEEPVVGLYRSHDAFYRESKAASGDLRKRMQPWIDSNVKVVENESGMLFTFGHLLGLRTGTICVALGSMFDEVDEKGDAIYAVYQDPNYMARRIEMISRITIRAIEILEEGK